MIMLNYVSTFLTFYIFGIFVSDYPIDGATINERNQACSLREWGCKNGGCISFEKRCDGEINCSDGSDEAVELCSADNFGLADAGSWSDLLSRSKRQSTRCKIAQFQCLNGQCINVDGMCDGQVDCSDGSDEILATCRINSCPDYLFRCSYGACVDGDAKCDGISQCADNSDEQNNDCGKAQGNRGTCTVGEWACMDGSCIESSQLCDGVKDCPDGSDETIQQCSQVPCASFLFRCSYGACVDSGSDCNGKIDCADGSDESPELCNKPGSGIRPTQIPTETPSPPQRQCVLPPYPQNGKYTATMGLKPGDVVPYTSLTYNCEFGYSIKDNHSPSCIMGTWLTAVKPTCERQCKPLTSISVSFKCYKQHSTLEISCNSPQDPNSRAQATCKNSYHSEPPPRDLTCIDGSWDYMPFCTPECGTVAPQGEKLVINGEAAKIGEFPWHVGLYDKTSDPIMQICGGTIFSPKLVVTAAHCVYNDQGGLYPASSFAVAAGKIYRRWNAVKEDEKYVQKSDVLKIEIPERYKGAIGAYASDIAVLILEKSFEFSSLVRPVCIRFDYKDNLNGQFGKVAGWGLTAEDGNASRILQTARLPFVSYQECYDNSPEGFRPLITSDKICAGYKNGTALCKGDSGGGLVFSRSHSYQDLYYLYGIVSTSPRNEALTSCSAFAYTGFTDLIKHREWFQDIWSRHNTIS